MAGLYGNELTMGLVLASWLLLMGGSTALAARLYRRYAAGYGGAEGRAAGADEDRGARAARLVRLLAATLLLVPLAVLVSLVLQQLTLPAFTSVGQVPGPAEALGSSLLCLLPPCLLLGGAFGLLSLQAPVGVPAERWAAWIYLWESLGTVLAGLLFHFLLAPLPLALQGVCAGLGPWLAGLALCRPATGPTGGARPLALAALAGAAALLFMVPALSLPGQAQLLQARLPGYQLLELRNSRHGALAVLRRGDQVIFSANGIPVFSNQDQQLVQADLHLSLLLHPAPRRVLLIGGGLGGGVSEVLRHPVRRLDYVELDPEMVELARRWGAKSQVRLDDPRVSLLAGDGRQVVASRPGAYDVILLGLPGPSSALINRFYTEEFFRSARRALGPGGMIRVMLSGSDTYLGDQQALLHSTVRAAMGRGFPRLVELPGQTTLLFGAARAPLLDADTLRRRMERRGLHSDYLGRAELQARLLPFARERYLERVGAVAPLANTDLRPAAYFQSTLHWLSLNAPGLARALSWLARASADRRWEICAGALLLALLAGLGLRRRSPAGPAIALAGFTGMVVELCLLLACQEQRGVIYHEVGALMTAFMAGLALGARLGAALARRLAGAALSAALGACACASLLGLLVMYLPGGQSTPALLLLLGVLCLLGLGVGACYAPASGLMAQRLGSGGAAARSYAWDLAGAAAGALLASAFVLPVLGLPDTCLLCAALCAGYALGVRR